MIRKINQALVRIDQAISAQAKFEQNAPDLEFLRSVLNSDRNAVKVEELETEDDSFFYNEDFKSPFSFTMGVGLHSLFVHDVTHLVFIRDKRAKADVYPGFSVCAFDINCMQGTDPAPFMPEIEKNIETGIRILHASDESEQGTLYAVSVGEDTSMKAGREFLESMLSTYPEVFDLL